MSERSLDQMSRPERLRASPDPRDNAMAQRDRESFLHGFVPGSEPITDSDIACASAACDLVRECRGQITGSHLARVAQLFADHRSKAKQDAP